MIHGLLMVLKIIGIVLLVLLGIVLFALLAVLFVPIQYKIKAGVNDGMTVADILGSGAPEKKDVHFAGDVSWLFGFLRVRAAFAEKKLSYCIKVICFTILDSEKKPDAKPPKEKKKQKRQKKKSANVQTVSQNKDSLSTEKADEPVKQPQEAAKAADRQEAAVPIEESSSKQPADDSKETKKAKKAKQFPDIGARMEKISGQITKILEIVNNEENQELVVFLFGSIKKLLGHIRPQKHDIDLYFGASDPSVTGQAYGAYCVANTVLEFNFRFVPDFEREILRLAAQLAGRVRIATVLLIAWKVYSNKTLKKLIGGSK